MFLKNPNAKKLKECGNDESRIGNNRRNAKLKFLDRIEDLVFDEMEKLDLQCIVDHGSNEGPYFKQYSYTDTLEGIRLHTTSAEINARVMQHCLDDSIEENVKSIDFTALSDKYALTIPEPDKVYDNVIFLTGSNFTYILKLDQLREILNDESEDWYVKPHPLTPTSLVHDLACQYGYNRVFESTVSGHAMYRQSKRIVTTSTSEFMIMAALDRKSFIDITKKHLLSCCTYGDIGHFMRPEDLEHNHRVATVCLGHKDSGYLHHSMSDTEVLERVRNYINLTQELRRPFKMLLGQKLVAMDTSMGPLENHELNKRKSKSRVHES